jgi:hypothetical protein
MKVSQGMTRWPGLFPTLLEQIPFVSEYPERAARTHVHVASSPDLDGMSGRFFLGCREARTRRIT